MCPFQPWERLRQFLKRNLPKHRSRAQVFRDMFHGITLTYEHFVILAPNDSSYVANDTREDRSGRPERV